MKTITFAGYSDDLVEISGDSVYDELLAPSREPFTAVVQDIETEDSVTVYVQYTRGGVWLVGVSPTDEDLPFPSWDMKITLDESASYSAKLSITGPDTIKITSTNVDDTEFVDV